MVEPILDVQADTHVNVYTAGVSDLKTEKVSIHVTGPLSDMKTELSSESGLAADEIVALLSIGWLYGKEGQIGVADPSKQYLFTEIVSQLESEISKLVTPLQNVSVMPGEEPGAAWRLNVRQTILPQVSVVYTRDLASIAEQGVSIHYNLHGQLYLNAAVERRQEEGAPADRYLLDLKMRFEYK